MNHQIVAGIIRNGDEILLVQERGPDDPAPSWVLPGGLVESGELLVEALGREISEKSGLNIAAEGWLAYVAQIDDPEAPTSSEGEEPHPGEQSLVFAYEIREWRGELTHNAPDGFVREAAFVPRPEAIRRLEQVLNRAKREPVVTYLRGDAAPGTIWHYRRTEADDELVARLPAVSLPGRKRRAPAWSDRPHDTREKVTVGSCLVIILCLIGLIVVGLIAVISKLH